MKIGKCMSRDKYAAERRRQRRHDFELGKARFFEMHESRKLSIEDATMIYPLQTKTDKK